MGAVPLDAVPDNHRISVLVQALREPLLVLDSDLRVMHASRAFYRTFKISPEEIQGHRLHEIGNGQWNIPALREALDRVQAGGPELDDFQLQHDFPALGRRTLLLNIHRLDDPRGTPLTLLAIEDLTPRREIELQAARDRLWLATTLSSIGDAVIATDTDARVTFINPTAERLTGWSHKEAIGRPLLEIFNILNEDSRKLVESPVTKAIRVGAVVGLANHTVLVARDRTEHPIDDSAAPIRDESGNILGVVMVFHDVAERRAAEKAQARLAEIVQSSDDAIVAKDLNGVIQSWNQGAEQLFGFSAEEALGKSILIIIPPDRLDEETDVLSRIRRGERIAHFETVRRRKDGSLVDISLSVSPLKNRRGEIIGASKTARDITERKRLQSQLQAHLINEQSLRMEAQAANRAKDLFLATLSHELRTPLSAIAGWVRILRSQGCKDEDLREGLEAIDRNARIQVQLIDDVLDVSRIVSGKLQLDVRPCDFSEIIRAALASVQPAADARGIRIASRIDPAATAGACDPARMQQIIWNLLTNAIKFTPDAGQITIALDRDGSLTRLTISDTGQGISPNFLPHVFDRFRQADSSTRRKFGGLGLGLSIVKQFVEMHGGTVHAQSPGEGKGATFTVELPNSALTARSSERPAPVPGEKNPAPDKTGEPPARLDGLQILVVDDQPDARRILARLLGDAGASVTTAASVPDALQSIERSRPHVLVSDLAMPDQDGYDLIRTLRAGGLDAKTLPAIALTAFAHKTYAHSALEAGFQVHIPKPVEPGNLLTVIAHLASPARAAEGSG